MDYTVVVSLLIFFAAVLIGMKLVLDYKNTYAEEIINEVHLTRASNPLSTYRIDYTIKRKYKNGKVEIYFKQINT